MLLLFTFLIVVINMYKKLRISSKATEVSMYINAKRSNSDRLKNNKPEGQTTQTV